MRKSFIKTGGLASSLGKKKPSSTPSSSIDESLKTPPTEVYRENRVSASSVPSVDLAIGELGLKFQNGAWSSIDCLNIQNVG